MIHRTVKLSYALSYSRGSSCPSGVWPFVSKNKIIYTKRPHDGSIASVPSGPVDETRVFV